VVVISLTHTHTHTYTHTHTLSLLLSLSSCHTHTQTHTHTHLHLHTTYLTHSLTLCHSALSLFLSLSLATSQVIQAVRICNNTLKKRLKEFEDTKSSQLGLDEFGGIDFDQEADPPSYIEVGLLWWVVAVVVVVVVCHQIKSAWSGRVWRDRF
jgi:hypothetical protein